MPADIDWPESLQRAFEGAQAAYCVTFSWAHFSAEREMAEIAAMAHAAKQPGTQHVIWSAMSAPGRRPHAHDDFDGKGASDHFFTGA